MTRPGNGKGGLPAASSAVVEDSVTTATAVSGVGTLTGEGSKVAGGGMAVKKAALGSKIGALGAGLQVSCTHVCECVKIAVLQSVSCMYADMCGRCMRANGQGSQPCIHTFTDTKMHTDIHTCMHACIHHTCIHTCMHACMHTYMHTYLHTYIL